MNPDSWKNFIFDEIPVCLSPMAGVTDAPFRELVSSFGASAVVTEVISGEALVRNREKTFRRLINGANDFPKIVQMMGANPENMAQAAVMAETLGADILDINMGCPARKITSNESGAALMKNEDLALKIVESIVKSIKIPVTVKMRLGWDNEHMNCLQLAKKLENVGVRMLTIHCRTRNQMYGGQADWSAIFKLMDMVKIPYLCNGDIRSGGDAFSALEQSGGMGVTVGRGALGRPWLLKQIMEFLHHGRIVPPPPLEDQYRIILRHFQNTMDFYGQRHGLRIFRKHFCWYSAGLSGSSAFREAITKSEDVISIKSHLEDFYAKHFRDILGPRKK
ncbi:MAG: tRNA dihydrouridine synthase DusB [Holosporaceae bacterium]|nr:tRNA dihydrouridine synthase DusB [Holosporaceae bacterium]